MYKFNQQYLLAVKEINRLLHFYLYKWKEENPPVSPFTKGGDTNPAVSPFIKGGLRGICIAIVLIFTLSNNSFSVNEEKVLMDYLWKKIVHLSPPKRPKIALVLGGGGARGLAHIGVLKVLQEENIPIDIIVGTSVGAIIGSLYSAGVSIEKIEKMGETVGWDDLTNFSAPALIRLMLTDKLLSSNKMEKFLKENIGNKRFDELNIEFACISTDLVTGERVIFRQGEVAPAARASATIPGIFTPVEYRHRYLVDGGLYDNIPTDVAKLFDADFIIAVTAFSDHSKNSLSNIYMVLTQAIYIQGRILDSERLKLADFVIQPSVGEVSTVDLGRSKECIEAGVFAARSSVLKLKRLLVEQIDDQYLFK